MTFNKDINKQLSQMGWSSFFQDQLENIDGETGNPARVVGVKRNSFQVSHGETEWLATVSGKLIHKSNVLYPVVGDWVLLNDTVISSVLQRRNELSRGAAGRRNKQNASPQRQQIIAANIDTVFIVCGLDRDFNLRRIERYLTLVYNCALNPVIVLTKADLQPDPHVFVDDVESVAFGVPVHLISKDDTAGLMQLEQYLSFGRTITMIGSSGAGKSTLVNRLYGENVQTTGSVSESLNKGKHTTTSREMIMMPQGAMIIDNPGIREIAFWEGEKGIENAFPEIEQLAGACRFNNCSHIQEPGCAVIQAVNDGELSKARLESYHKMKHELDYLAQRQSKSADKVEKDRWKNVALKVKAMKKGGYNK